MKPMWVATEKKVVRFDECGDIVWQATSGMARDVWQLPNGNVLFPFNQQGSCGVREATPSGKTAWEFRLPGQYVISCQRMNDGNTLVEGYVHYKLNFNRSSRADLPLLKT